jgi:hypothetical protein
MVIVSTMNNVIGIVITIYLNAAYICNISIVISITIYTCVSFKGQLIPPVPPKLLLSLSLTAAMRYEGVLMDHAVLQAFQSPFALLFG